jgi:pimeloyl-ACP methyl ester carboxylesterase
MLCAALFAPTPVPETRLAQVAPAFREEAQMERSGDQRRGVLLIHGLQMHTFSSRNVLRAAWPSWQRPGSTLVTALAREADVFAFAYGQDVPPDRVASSPPLRDAVQQLRDLGYTEIVLVGHSAGGVIAREFAEDYPDAGVTRVIQVGAPNAGSNLARVRAAVRRTQHAFLSALTRRDRQQCLQDRADRKIPDKIEFVCIVCRLGLVPGSSTRGLLHGDGVVACESQWPEDLQEQGVPAVMVNASHGGAMYNRACAETIARLVREPQPRWDETAVRAARPQVLGEE